MNNPSQRMRDVYRYNDTTNALELATADRRFEQLIERRERLIERSRFGVLALNGASAAGILSSFSELHSDLGADPRLALAAFGLGMGAALLSIFFETNFLGTRAAHMFGHLSRLRQMRATLDSDLTEKNQHRFDEQLKALEERAKRDVLKIKLDDSADGLPNDFAYSPAALLLLNGGGAFWIAGITALLVDVFT